jgi:hypothetical protein
MGVMAVKNREDIVHLKYIFLPLLTCGHFYHMLTILNFIAHDLPKALTYILRPKGRFQTFSHRNIYFGELLKSFSFSFSGQSNRLIARERGKKELRMHPI